MRYRINQIKLNIDHDEKAIEREICRKLKKNLLRFMILK